MNPTARLASLAGPALLLCCCLGVVLAAEEKKPAALPAPVGTIERLDPKFDGLVAKDAVIEKLAEGFEWAEGPVWVKDGNGGYLLFSDVPHNVVNRWAEGKGLSEFLRPSGYTGTEPYEKAEGTLGEPGSNGLTIGPDGLLVLCQHGDRRVARLNKDGQFETLADKVYDKAGNLYFTDPPYGLKDTFKNPKRELPFTGVYRLGTDGKVTLLTKDMTAPNGIALSPDEQTLYVANSDPEKAIWMAFERKGDGVGNGRVLFDSTPQFKAGKKGLPDGLKVAQDGTLFATGPGGVYVLTPDGKHLGTIDPGEATANCAFGGPDGTTLYMTSDMFLCRVKTNAKGLGF
jgi:gluconolactonase